MSIRVLRSRGGTDQYGETGQEIVDKDDAADQVRDLQRRLQRLRSVDGRPALPLGVLHHDGGDVEFVLVGVVARLDGEGLKESDADADDAHGHAAPDQQEKAHAETQADLGHDEAAVGGVEAVDRVVPAHRRERGQDERHHPDPHHRVHRLLLGVAQPGRTRHVRPLLEKSGPLASKDKHPPLIIRWASNFNPALPSAPQIALDALTVRLSPAQ